MSEDKFENQKPQLSLSADKIETIGIEGNVISDEFVITSVGDIPIKGLVYSSNPYYGVAIISMELLYQLLLMVLLWPILHQKELT